HRIEMLPRQPDVGARRRAASGRARAGAEYVDHALDEPVVLDVDAGAEVEDEVAVGPVVTPRLVGHDGEEHRTDALRRLAVADVDDAPVVELHAAGAVRTGPQLVAAGDRERKVAARIVEPPVVLRQPLLHGAELDARAVLPEPT